MTTNRPARLALISAMLVFPLACERSCDGEASAGGGGSTRAEGEETRPVTEDGYEVILANPSAMQKRSKQGDRNRERDRERWVMEPTSPDPHEGTFTLEEAVVDLPLDGQLVAEVNSDLGTFFCDLFADRVPVTVANFIGLARGRRAFWDPRAGQWVNRPLYNMSKFHRVVPEFGIQFGDFLEDGESKVGFGIPYEPHETLSHDEAGLLCMASEGPSVESAQVFITDGPLPRLDGGYTVFGQCRPVDAIERIARVAQTGAPDNRPLTDVVIRRVSIRRVRGGAAQAKISQPSLPEGYDPSRPEGRGASPGPSEIDVARQLEERRRIRAEERAAGMR
jgi:peptidyl-prolyl cis-trans isomerase A (cyclophilin A)